MLTQAYIDAKFIDWSSRLPALSAALRDQLQIRLELEQVERELKTPDQLTGVPLDRGMVKPVVLVKPDVVG